MSSLLKVLREFGSNVSLLNIIMASFYEAIESTLRSSSKITDLDSGQNRIGCLITETIPY